LLLDVGIAQRIFERGELLAMDADATGEKDALGNWKHRSSIIRALAGYASDSRNKTLQLDVNIALFEHDPESGGRPSFTIILKPTR
jgi:hypothetical protein